MSVECIKEGAEKFICKFDERMDTTKCMEAEKIITGELENITEIIFDLTGVEYIASSFLRLCGIVARKVDQDKFCITNVTPTVRRVFAISGLDKTLNLMQSKFKNK
jgi:anti-anti-sigma factor